MPVLAQRNILLNGNSLNMDLLNEVFRNDGIKISVSEEILEKVGLARKALVDYLKEASHTK